MTKHHDLVNILMTRLIDKNRYDTLLIEYEYERGDLSGEFDLLGINNNYATYYEVKSTYNQKSVQKAKKQFLRAYKAFPDYDWRFVLFTPEKVERMYL